jgi:hypothetical protein
VSEPAMDCSSPKKINKWSIPAISYDYAYAFERDLDMPNKKISTWYIKSINELHGAKIDNKTNRKTWFATYLLTCNDTPM